MSVFIVVLWLCVVALLAATVHLLMRLAELFEELRTTSISFHSLRTHADKVLESEVVPLIDEIERLRDSLSLLRSKAQSASWNPQSKLSESVDRTKRMLVALKLAETVLQVIRAFI